MIEYNEGDKVRYSRGKGEHYSEYVGVIRDVRVKGTRYAHIMTDGIMLEGRKQCLPVLVSYKNILEVL